MNSRRDVIATLGMVAVAGCTTDTSQEATSQPDNPAEPDRELSIPLDGLGAYEDAVREAGRIKETVSTGARGIETTVDDIHNMLEQTNSVDEEREWLAEHTPVQHDELHQVMHEYHRQKDEGDDQVVANINWSFTGQSKPIAEFYTVQNGNLQGQPSITYQKGIELLTNHPGQDEPSALANLRQSDKAGLLPEDIDGLNIRIEDAREYEDATDEQIRDLRENVFSKWSYSVPGLGDGHMIKPENIESGNIVMDAKYGDGETEPLTELANQYAESDHFNNGVMTTVNYNGEEWEFTDRPDHQMSDQIYSKQ